ncbi:MAG: hypothetical protein ACOYJE_00465 [Bacteroidaceae bacterium]
MDSDNNTHQISQEKKGAETNSKKEVKHINMEIKITITPDPEEEKAKRKRQGIDTLCVILTIFFFILAILLGALGYEALFWVCTIFMCLSLIIPVNHFFKALFNITWKKPFNDDYGYL